MQRPTSIVRALRWVRKACGLALLLAACAQPARAVDVPDTPEIDPGMASGAVGAAACGLMMLTDKIRRK